MNLWFEKLAIGGDGLQVWNRMKWMCGAEYQPFCLFDFSVFGHCVK